MSRICTTVTSWVTKAVLAPVNTWVAQQQQQCKQLKPWWNPLKLLCWIVTVTVLVVVWVTQYIVVPIVETICNLVTFLIGGIMLPFAAAIDAVCATCNAATWVTTWFITRARITFIRRVASRTRPNYYDYTFVCNCSVIKKPSITVEAATDQEAAALAKDECAKQCA